MDDQLVRKFTPTFLKANDDGSITMRLTTLTVDRHGEVVKPDGVILKNYIKNPIVLFQHGWSEQGMIPIGRILPDTIVVTKKYIDASIMFDENDEFAAKVADKLRNGFLNAGSIGFRRIETSEEPILAHQSGVTFIKWELYEFSIVPIPANPEAVRKEEFARFRKYCIDQEGVKSEEFDNLLLKHYKDTDNVESAIEVVCLGEFDEYRQKRIDSIKKQFNFKPEKHDQSEELKGLKGDVANLLIQVSELKEKIPIATTEEVKNALEISQDMIDEISNNINIAKIYNNL